MKKNLSSLLFISSCLLLFTSCKKDHATHQNTVFKIPCYGFSSPKPVAYIQGADTGIYAYDAAGRIILDSLTKGIVKRRVVYSTDSTAMLYEYTASDQCSYYIHLNADGYTISSSRGCGYPGSIDADVEYSGPGIPKRITQYYYNNSPYSSNYNLDTIRFDANGNIDSVFGHSYNNDFHQPFNVMAWNTYDYYTAYDYKGGYDPFDKLYCFSSSFPQVFSKNLIQAAHIRAYSPYEPYGERLLSYTFNANGYVRSVTDSSSSIFTRLIFYDCE